jgi:hypothetical protein
VVDDLSEIQHTSADQNPSALKTTLFPTALESIDSHRARNKLIDPENASIGLGLGLASQALSSSISLRMCHDRRNRWWSGYM